MRNISYKASIALTGFVGVLALTGYYAASARGGRQCGYPMECKQARSDERAVSEYRLNTQTGTLTRMMEADGGQRDRDRRDNRSCSAASNVVDFKISQHRGDAAAVYFIKSYNNGQTGDLYYLPKSDQTVSYAGNCPPANARLLMSDIKKSDGDWQYGVVTSSDTQLVNYALSRNGTFKAWPRTSREGRTVSYSRISDLEGNQCYDQNGKRFASKIIFLRSMNGSILSMDNDGDITNHGYQSSIDDFQRQQRFMASGQCLNSDGSEDYLLNPRRDDDHRRGHDDGRRHDDDRRGGGYSGRGR